MSASPIRVAFGHDTLVANGEYAFEALHLVERIDRDAAAATQVLLGQIANGLCCHTAHPNKRTCGDGRAVFEHHAVVAIVRHHLAQEYVDAHLAQVLLHVGRTLLAHSREQAVARFDEVDIHQSLRQVGIVLRQHVVLHFRERTGYLHARGAAAHNDDVEQLLSLHVTGTRQGALEVVQKGIAQAHRLADILHGHGFLLHVLIAKEVGRRTSRQHEIVVVHLADARLDDFLLGEDGAHLGHAVVEILALLENLAKGEGDTARFDA